MNKYYVVEGVNGRFYPRSEGEILEDSNYIVATCKKKDNADLICKALMKYVHEQNVRDNMDEDEEYCPFCESAYNVNDGHSCMESRW